MGVGRGVGSPGQSLFSIVPLPPGPRSAFGLRVQPHPEPRPLPALGAGVGVPRGAAGGPARSGLKACARPGIARASPAPAAAERQRLATARLCLS